MRGNVLSSIGHATPTRRARRGTGGNGAGHNHHRGYGAPRATEERTTSRFRSTTLAEGTAFDLLIPPLKRALQDVGYEQPTPIQEQSIQPLLAGRDMLGCAQTGTGKTAAFALPILQYLDANRKRPIPGHPRVLVLAPTRELAAQIGESVFDYGKYLRVAHTVIFGGVNQRPQVGRLRRGLDILVATPGRLLDLMQQGHVRLDGIEVFVLDEADRMLDMGFLPDVRKIIARLPEKRQSLFYSATLSREVTTLAGSLVADPVHVSIAPEKPTVDKVEQKLYFVDKENKDHLLASVLEGEGAERVLVFTRTKHGANKVAQKLDRAGYRAAAIHGNKSQAARTRALGDFKTGRVRVLVATDIAARGIDVDRVSHVINYDLPNEPETYVHRIGRTARAGLEGVAISFCSAEERSWLRAIERLIRQQVPEDRTHGFHSEHARTANVPPPVQGGQWKNRRPQAKRGWARR